ncbi:hypothetical protein AVEN_206216-1 [Araneus ventricosus]|uniref:Uncharacterized protein n=1 Tax=Araneus ventricosus TaxID=182803 RepID=A0A4Y2G8Z8_ARAVE|nr:hypothetical protein AVEN_206216-1 [Araneus ventricosus]
MFTGPMQPQKQQVVVRAVLLHSVCVTHFGGIWAFLQQQRASTPAAELIVSSGVWHLQQVAIVCRCGDSPVSRPTPSTGVFIPLVMVSHPMDDTTMHIQLSGNSILPCTSLKHTESPPTHLIVQMFSSTHAFCFGYLGFHGTIAACELKHRSCKPFYKALLCDRGIVSYATFGCLFAFGCRSSVFVLLANCGVLFVPLVGWIASRQPICFQCGFGLSWNYNLYFYL